MSVNDLTAEEFAEVRAIARDAHGFAAYVDCDGYAIDGKEVSCGTQGLTPVQYLRQLSDPYRPWRCPKCNNSAQYNDDRSEKAQGIT